MLVWHEDWQVGDADRRDVKLAHFGDYRPVGWHGVTTDKNSCSFLFEDERRHSAKRIESAAFELANSADGANALWEYDQRFAMGFSFLE